MKRRRILLPLALAAVVMGIVVFWPSGPKEPVYQGKPLSLWLDAAGTSSQPLDGSVASRAIHTLGTNALPWLLYEFSSQMPTNGFRVAVNRWADKHPRLPFRFPIDRRRVTRAATGLQMLGSAVTPALPELAGYFGDYRRANDAVLAMAGAGELAIPWFHKALAPTNAVAAVAAVGCLQRLAMSSAEAIPPLVEALQHGWGAVRRTAAWALDAPTARPDLVVPALTRALSDVDDEVRRWAAQGLGSRAEHAASALPALRRLMTDPSRQVAQEASNAVSRIEQVISQPRGH